jgi:RNA polymerase sigma factor (sigma-70 family)
MNSGHLVLVLRHLRRLAGARENAELTDRHLLERYIHRRDEAAFAALVQRHGGMVWDVCRRVLADVQDADDAFQATFLVLIHKAASLRQRESLAGFLQGVAWRLARRLKADAVRRQYKEGRAEVERIVDPVGEAERRDLRTMLDEELDRLPEKYRAPLVLCYLEGLSYAEAARRLGWRDGTVCGRLARGREMLRRRLSRRGLALSGAALLATLAEPAAAPAASVAVVLRTAALFALGQSAGVVSVSVATLARGVLHTMTVTKLKSIAALAVVLGVFAAGAGLGAHRVLTARGPQRERDRSPAERRPEQPQKEQAAHTDLYGDPLPPEVVARLGTVRFRHGENVFALAFSPDGARLLSADWYGARLWDAASGREIRRIGPRFPTSLQSVALTPDGKTAALAERHQGTIEIWDVVSGKFLRRFRNGEDNNDRFCDVKLSPSDKVLASLADKIIRLWDPATGAKLRQWAASEETVHGFVFSPDGKTLISGGDDRIIRFWDTATGKEVRRIADHPGMVSRLALSPDGKILASLGATRHEFKNANSTVISWNADNKIHLWNVTTGKKLHQLEAAGPARKKNERADFHPQAISNFVFAPDSKTLVTGGQDRTVRVWDVEMGRELRRWESLWVTSFAFSPDGKILAIGSIDHTLRLWNTRTGHEVREQAGHRSGVHFLVLSPDGRRVASASSDRTVRIWDAASGRQLHCLRGPEGEMRPLAFSADGRKLTTVGTELTVNGADRKGRVWDTASGEELRQLPDMAECAACAVSPDGRTYALVVKDHRVVLWDAAAGRKLPTRIEDKKGIGRLAFSPDNRVLFTASSDRTVRVWDIATGKELRHFTAGDEKDTYALAFSPDGRWVAWAGQEHAIHLHDLATGEEVRRITSPSAHISPLAFSPDGRMLASASWYEPTICLWETASGQLRRQLPGHQGPLFSLVFSPDGKRLFSGSADNTALVWGLTAGAERPSALSPAELDARWRDLASADAETAYQAIGKLTAAPKSAAAFLRKQLRPIPTPDPKRVARLLADLEGDAFAQRERAAKELEKLGSAVEPALREAVAGSDAPELRRRLGALLAKGQAERRTPSAARLQFLRALEVLERIGRPEARRVLRELADGAQAAWQTCEAKAVLDRLTAAKPPGR